MQELNEEEQMPPTNKRAKARHNPHQQPSLLDHLELDEEPGHEDAPRREDPSDEAAQRHTGEPTAEPANLRPDAACDPYDRASEPLEKAYARYVEIINETYDSRFSDAKRNAAFKEAAKAHGVRITDLKRYSTAAALNIPYHDSGGADPEHGAASDQETDASVTNTSESDASETG